MRPTILATALVLAACRNAAPEPAAPAQVAESAARPSTTAPPRPAQTLHWTDPAAWRRIDPTSTMRRAQFVIPAAAGAGDGELTVFWFGTGQGGSVESNLERWYGQFEQRDGRPTASVATRETRTSHGLNVTVTRVDGRYTGAGMPGAGAMAARDGYSLLGAIVDTPNGPWFFKLTGPRDTVVAAAPVFDEFVRSFEFR